MFWPGIGKPSNPRLCSMTGYTTFHCIVLGSGRYTECPEKKTTEAAKPNPFDKGYVNHVHLEGAYNEPGMENGTFYSSIQFEV